MQWFSWSLVSLLKAPQRTKKTIIKLIEQRRELQAAIIEFGKCYEAPHTHMKASGNDDIRIFLFLHIYSNHRVTRLYRGTANVVH